MVNCGPASQHWNSFHPQFGPLHRLCRRDLCSVRADARHPHLEFGGIVVARPLIHFILDLLIDSAPLFLKRQCDQTRDPHQAADADGPFRGAASLAELHRRAVAVDDVLRTSEDGDRLA